MNEIPVLNIQPTNDSNRKIWTIAGGVHPPENKQQSLRFPIKKAALPKSLILPLSQHIGTPAIPCVSIGDRVLKGQTIADANGHMSVPVHASSSGIVVSIENRPIAHASGLNDLCIIIEVDDKDECFSGMPRLDYLNTDRSILLERIRQSGIAGMGGAGFPSSIKLSSKQSIDTLIINATECEPYITSDDALMRERSDDIIEGIKILQHILQPSVEVLIGIEDNKATAINILQDACRNEEHIHVVVFPTKYPSGGEKQLISILTGREVPSEGLPADIGIVCHNIGTCAAIKDAIIDGQPLISRITTVTGNTVQPQNYEVALGTPVSHLLAQSSYQAQEHQPVIMGGPMMGFALDDLNSPIVKTSNCILAPSANELPNNPIAQACIRCGICAEVCPASLLPQQLYWFSRSRNHTQLEKHNLFDCIECGACSYSCPSHIPLVQYYRSSKSEIREEREDHIKAEKAKERFEFRQERLKREEIEKERRRKERKEAAMAAKNNTNKQDIISAAIARTSAKNRQSADVKQTPPTAEALHEKDNAAAAIERAQQSRANESNLSEAEQRVKQLETLEKRLASQEKKYLELLDTDPEKAQLVKSSLDKLASKKAKLMEASS